VLKQPASGVFLPGKNGFHAKQDFSELVMLTTNNGFLPYEESMGGGDVAAPGSTTADSLPATPPAQAPAAADSAGKPDARHGSKPAAKPNPSTAHPK
jgi:hypothetical protein